MTFEEWKIIVEGAKENLITAEKDYEESCLKIKDVQDSAKHMDEMMGMMARHAREFDNA